MATDAWGASWGGAFTRFVRWGASEQVTLPTFGPPFLDLQALTRTTLGASSLVNMTPGVDCSFPTMLESHVGMASPRISRSVL